MILIVKIRFKFYQNNSDTISLSLSHTHTNLEMIETPLEKYFGTHLSWCCRTDPIDFENDPAKVKELILADCKVERIIDKIGN